MATNDRMTADQRALSDVMTEDLRQRQGEKLSVLDQLRRTRAARGGVGAPLQIPARLATPILLTDADLSPTKPFSDGAMEGIEASTRPGLVDGDE